MPYTFYNITTKKESSLDLMNCTITGNSAVYDVKDGKITKYKIVDGKPDKSTTEEVSRIDVTGYQMSFFDMLKGRDGDSTRLDKSDLKDLTPESLQSEINAVYKEKAVYEAIGAKTDKYNAEINIADSKSTDKKIGIKFEKVGFFKRIWNGICNFFKSLFGCKKEEVPTPIEKAPAEYRPVDLTNTFNDNIQVDPAYEYTAKGGEKPYILAKDLGVSLSRLKEANPDSNLDWVMEKGQKIKVPEKLTVKAHAAKNITDIAETVGVSENYIKDILFGIEGRHSEPDLTPYYDGVGTKGNKKGVLTIGFGHTGRVHGVEMNSKNKDKIKITRDEAYQLLAQDILDSKIEAIMYFGQDFLDAPQSIQDGIVDIIFNKGVERGLEGIIRDEKGSIKDERLDTETRKLKQDLRNKDYTAAAKHMIYKTPLKGLRKRNVYRAITSLKDLAPEQREFAMKALEKYFQDTKILYPDSEALYLDTAWNNARKGICENFFSKRGNS